MLSRRLFMIGLPAVALAACSSSARTPRVEEPTIDPYYQAMYGTLTNEKFVVQAMDLRRVDPKWWRQEVEYATSERPGTIVVDTPQRYLFLVLEGGRALRYGIGVGKNEALVFRGTATIGRKAEWPRWTPTQSMIKREPDRYERNAFVAHLDALATKRKTTAAGEAPDDGGGIVAAAAAVPATSPLKGPSKARAAAFVDLVHTLVNTNEFTYRF